MSEGNPDKTREDGPAPTEIGEASVRPEKTVPTQKVSESRRRFAKAGLLVPPILMSVASRPVLGQTMGVPCISNMLSGNMSSPGMSCQLGQPPEYWLANISLWPEEISAGFQTTGPGSGTVPTNCDDCVSGSNWKCIDGTLFSEYFDPNTDWPGEETRQMYEILCAGTEDPNSNNPQPTPEDSEKAAHITALLNAFTSDYVLKYMQVQDLWDGVYIHVNNKEDFLKKTWGDLPWDGDW